MRVYSCLFESLMDCIDSIGLRHLPVYTAAMLALAICLCLDLLSGLNLLWASGVLGNPYLSNGSLHPHQYVYRLLYLGFLANLLLARINFAIDRQRLRALSDLTTAQLALPTRSLTPTLGATFVLMSALTFVATLSWPLVHRG
jgi:hypothetical protein